jgi:uncharacterized protein YcgL (UPF0745 family)
MLCAVYKTRKKVGTYLYVLRKDDFSDVPEALMSQFVKPELVTIISLDKRDKMGVDKEKLVNALKEQGFYLQLPPKEEDLLSQHRVALGLNATPDKKF